MTQSVESPPGGDSRIEIKAEGAGPSLSLSILVLTKGRGGGGVRYRPRAYRELFEQKETYLYGRPNLAGLKYTGLANRPVKLTQEEAHDWLSFRDAYSLLSFLSKATKVELICDDFDYGVYWGKTSIAPNGEPLGWWLDALPMAFRTPHNLNGARLRWREVDRCLLIRNEDWMSETLHRPDRELTGWLEKVQAKPGGPPYSR